MSKESSKLLFGLEYSYYWQPGVHAVTLDGITYVPNETVGYIEFKCAQTLPAGTDMKTMLHPATVRKCCGTMLHQQVNLNHQLRSNENHLPVEKRKIKKDRIIGSIVAVSFPYAPEGGWKFGRDKTNVPFLRGVASLFKQADGMDKIIGGHQSGRHSMEVSMEMDFKPLDSGFLIDSMNPVEGYGGGTPNNLRDAGWLYVPTPEAPEDLLLCWDKKKGAITKQWRGKDVYMLCGGVGEGEMERIHFSGLGVVDKGLEEGAEIIKLAAGRSAESGEEEEIDVGPLVSATKNITSALQKLVD